MKKTNYANSSRKTYVDDNIKNRSNFVIEFTIIFMNFNLVRNFFHFFDYEIDRVKVMLMIPTSVWQQLIQHYKVFTKGRFI